MNCQACTRETPALAGSEMVCHVDGDVVRYTCYFCEMKIGARRHPITRSQVLDAQVNDIFRNVDEIETVFPARRIVSLGEPIELENGTVARVGEIWLDEHNMLAAFVLREGSMSILETVQ